MFTRVADIVFTRETTIETRDGRMVRPIGDRFRRDPLTSTDGAIRYYVVVKPYSHVNENATDHFTVDLCEIVAIHSATTWDIVILSADTVVDVEADILADLEAGRENRRTP